MSKIDNKKIPTVLGTVIIVIIAITVGALVWKYEKIKSQDEGGVEFVKSTEEKQNPQKEENEEFIDALKWKVCRNEKANYEFKYPGEWLIVDRYLTILDKCYNASDPRGSWFSIGEDRYSASNKSFGIDTSAQKDLKGTIYEGADSLDSYYSKNVELLNSRTKIMSTEIKGERADWFKEKNDKISIWFFHNNTLYEIRSNINNQKILESIIKTFSFPSN
ncbi:MAG: hypothetical protein Q8L10_05605 [Candidatus Moranbacteria bacterium]|nr:hypothetical protein [Candidatus Moranbacteria bacterium]